MMLVLGVAGCVPATDLAPPAAAGDVGQQLMQLTVATQGSMRGYRRDRFPHWRPVGENCDVRDQVLRRDGMDLVIRGCNVIDGRWLSPYDDRTYTDTRSVDVDHVVPLANAWRSGADDWTDERRGDFANDVTRPELRAVSRSVNRAKGDQDPSQWKPPNRGHWCRYAQDWIAVKHHWRLTVTVAEKSALVDMLETCPWPQRSTAVPTSSPARAG